jgi:uncharacterized damage-inducible protein DinB
MTRVVRSALAVSLAMALAPAIARAQAPKNTREVLLNHWKEIGDKVVKMAEEFPEAKYEFQATKDVRTFADVLRHVAFWNQYVAKTARNEKPDPKPNELPKAQYATKAAIVKALKESLDDATAELTKQPETLPLRAVDLFTSFIGHSSEHYGQLVVYFRLNGLVPPASR